MRRRFALLVPLVAVIVAGCGTDDTAAPDDVRAALAQVDAAVQAHDYGRARTVLDTLVARTIAARDRATIAADQATAILAAAAQLRADLPQATPATPAAQPSPSTTSKDDASGKKKGHDPKGHDPKGHDPKGHGHGNGQGEDD